MLRLLRQVSRSLRPTPFLVILSTDFGTTASDVAGTHLRQQPAPSASSCGRRCSLINPLGASRKHRSPHPVRSRHVPRCRALRAARACDLFLTDGCVALCDPRRSRELTCAAGVVRCVRNRWRGPHWLKCRSPLSPGSGTMPVCSFAACHVTCF